MRRFLQFIDIEDDLSQRIDHVSNVERFIVQIDSIKDNMTQLFDVEKGKLVEDKLKLEEDYK
jgi:hypothetical protein